MGGAGLIGSLPHLTTPFSVEGGVGGPIAIFTPLLCAYNFQWQRLPLPCSSYFAAAKSYVSFWVSGCGWVCVGVLLVSLG